MAKIKQSGNCASFLLPGGEKAGPVLRSLGEAGWEDEGEWVLQSQYLIPLTFPLLAQLALSSPPGGEENRSSGAQAAGGS